MESESFQEGSIMPVTCGHLTGKLHHAKFLCPGIHMECIEVDGDFVTPKIFSVMGDKERLKDWKNAVRVNGVSVRRLMECGQLDFYCHKEQCSGRCIGKPNAKVKVDGIVVKCDLPTQVNGNLGQNYSLELSSLSAASLGLTSKAIMNNRILLPKSFNGTGNRTYSVTLPASVTSAATSQVPVTTRTSNSSSQSVFPQAIPVFSSINSGLSSGQNGGLFLETMDSTEFDTSLLEDGGGHGDVHSNNNGYDEQEEDIKPSAEYLERLRASMDDKEMTPEEAVEFWRGILDVGLLDEFFRDAKTALDLLKSEIIKKRVRIQDATRISRIVHELGITTKLKTRLSLHQQEAEQQNERLQWEIEELKRKMAETEQRQLHLKRKSDAFNHLLGMSNSKKQAIVIHAENDTQDSEQE